MVRSGRGFVNGVSQSLEMSGLITVTGSGPSRGASVVQPTWHGGWDEWGPCPQLAVTTIVARNKNIYTRSKRSL